MSSEIEVCDRCRCEVAVGASEYDDWTFFGATVDSSDHERICPRCLTEADKRLIRDHEEEEAGQMMEDFGLDPDDDPGAGD